MYQRFIASVAFVLAVTFAVGVSGADTSLASTIKVKIEEGDRLSTIATRYFKQEYWHRWHEIAKLNALTDPDVLKVGNELRLPTALLAQRPWSIQVVGVVGNVQVVRRGGVTPATAQIVKVHDSLYEGDLLLAEAKSNATLQLADGSRMVLMADSQVVVEEHRYRGLKPTTTPMAHHFTGLLRLIQGSIEAYAKPSKERAKPLRIQTPTSVVGVRGTEFRVTHDALLTDASLNPLKVTRSEVVTGDVTAALDVQHQVSVRGGYGVRLEPDKELQVKPLLDPPDVANWPLRQDRLTLEFPALPAVQQSKPVSGYRVQVQALAAQGENAGGDIVSDQRVKAGEVIRIAGLPDGDWRVKVRAIDPDGLEGQHVFVPVTLKARPEAPIVQSPKPNQKLLITQGATLQWLKTATPANGHETQAVAKQYLVEIASADGQMKSYQTENALLQLQGLDAGSYQWRVATQLKLAQQSALDQGPWSDWQRFTLMALPDLPEAKMNDEERSLVLQWRDQKASKYELQLARNASFDMKDGSPAVQMLEVEVPEAKLTQLASGVHFVRYRAIERDGFIGAWSAPMQINVPIDWKQLLFYLGGATKQWP